MKPEVLLTKNTWYRRSAVLNGCCDVQWQMSDGGWRNLLPIPVCTLSFNKPLTKLISYEISFVFVLNTLSKIKVKTFETSLKQLKF